jgi:hypothetical protein
MSNGNINPPGIPINKLSPAVSVNLTDELTLNQIDPTSPSGYRTRRGTIQQLEQLIPVGPQGPQGPQGPTGPIGPTGIGLVNINTLLSSPLVPDGVTSNIPMLQSLASTLQGASPEMPVPVNITIGIPTVLTINPTVPSGGVQPNPTLHFLKPNQAFYFILSAGGSLPAGISLNTPYYITSANLTATTFTFSSVNNYGTAIGEGSPVNTTGYLTGTLSIVLTGRDIDLFIPSGAYFGGNYGDANPNLTITPNGITRIRYFGYGAIFDTKTSFGTPRGPAGGYGNAKTWAVDVYDYVNTTPQQVSQLPGFNGVITLVTKANAANYFIGQWIAIFGLDIQDHYGIGVSGPPNAQYQEFKRIIAVDTNAGTLTLDGPLRWIYLSTFPHLFTPSSVFVAPGNASITPMHPSWDTEIEVHGVRWVGQTVSSVGRRFVYKDCVFQGFANDPGQAAMAAAQSYIYHNCRFGPSMAPGATYMEVDKMLEYLELDGCSAFNHYQILFSSPSLQVCNIKNHQGSLVVGTPRQLKVTDSILDGIQIGPYIGVSDSVQIYNTRFTYFDMLSRNDDANSGLGPNNDMTLMPNWSFSGGTFTRNISTLPGGQGMTWQIPGAKIYITDASNQYQYYQNMGAVFAILNVYMDGSGNFSFDTTLSAIPSRQTSSTVTISIASPGVVTWNSHGLSAGTPVVFTTTGAPPTGLIISTIYWVANDGNLGTNTFAVSDTLVHALAGTNQINTSGSQSGTQSCFANPLCFRPHPCARLTSVGNSGCNTMMDQNGAIDEPLFSRVRRVFVGKQSNLGGESQQYQYPNPKIWGYIKTMTVNVRKAGVASGTLTISCPGFTQPNLTLSNFSQVIDTTVVGLRTVTGTTATGSMGSDSIVAYADWISGPLIFTWSTGVTLTNSPIVEFEIFTDQGLTRFGNMMGAPAVPASGSELWQWVDSGIIQQYGSTP